MTDLSIAGETPTWTLQDRLRKAREHRGLQQAQLAEVTGISARSIQNYEAGRTTPKRPQLIAWAMATGVALTWLELGDIAWNQIPADVTWGDDAECAIRDSNPEPADVCFGRVA